MTALDTEARLTLLRRVAESANAATTAEDAGRLCIALVLDLTRWSFGMLYLVEDGVARATDVWCSSDTERFEPMWRTARASPFAAGVGLAGRVLDQAAPVTIVGFDDDSILVRHDEANAAGLRAAYAVPIWVRDEVAGVVEFFSERDEELDVGVREVLEQIGTQLGRVVERQRHARALAASEERARRVVDAASDAYIAIDSEDTISAWNAAAERVFGWAADEVIGKRLVDTLIPERYRAAHLAGMRRFLSTGEGPLLGRRAEIAGLHRDGHELPVELAIWATDEGGGRWSFNAFVSDITERRVADRELQLAYERERDMVTQLTQLDRNKADFMSMVSHELRTPLTSIIGYLDLLRAGHGDALTDKQEDMLSVVDRNAHRLLELIDDIVTLDRLESGRLPLELGPVDVAALVDHVIDAVTPLASARGQRLTADIRPSVGSIVGDGEQLERVLLNLASNAVKFTPRGGAVNVVADGDDDRVQLTVVDTGMGIPAEEQPRLFSRFFRSSTARAAAVPGTGLGLVIARSIVEAHDGSIELVSAENEGTVVTVTVPRVSAG